jgi:hypothetical protein
MGSNVSDLILNILSRSDKRGLTETADGLDDLGDKADKTGKKFKGMGEESRHLDEEIVKSKQRIRELGEEFDKTGNKELFPQLRKERGNLINLEKIKKDLGQAGDEGGLIFGSKFMNSVSGFQPTGMVQWLVGAAVLAAPAVGAAVSAAVLLALGGGTLAGGIILAAKDPAVKTAFDTLGAEVSSDLTDASRVFVEPLVHSAGILRTAWGEVGSDIADDFDAVAPSVEHLAAGVAGFARNVMPGFNDAVQRSAPLLNQLGDDTLPRMGTAIGTFFSTISAGAPGAQAFFADLTTGVDLSIKQLGAVTLALSKLYEEGRSGSVKGSLLTGTLNLWTDALDKLDGGGNKVHKSFQLLHQDGDDVAASVNRIGLGAALTSDQFSKLSGQISATAQTSDQLAGAMVDRLLGATMSLDQATLGFAEAQTRLGQAITDGGRELDIHTEKGQANRTAVLGAVQANIAQYDALIRSGAGAEQAAAAYDANTAALEAQLHKAHFTQAEIDGLIGKYRSVPDNVDTDVRTHGLQEAINSLEDAIRLANHLDGRVSVLTIEERHRTTYDNATAPSNVSHGMAKGGVIRAAQGLVSGILAPRSPGTLILAGEPQTRGEVLAPLSGITQQRAMGLAATIGDAYDFSVTPNGYGHFAAPSGGRAGSGGGNSYTINVSVPVGGSPADAGAAVVQAIKEYEMYNGSSWRG